ncbi:MULTISPECIES: SHOCT domain-containing protein [Pseudobacteroides]|uniref:SHOCT-like domain-containing protein n=1 Tax=Pseudobacteroides cellulosolvens ATCC 35603 = DSM 2933 TaxID=398512 RepID=A0A0L6JUA1_9FIRM|nr:SHOCT domain-containing protein [Pseudobacteroides cellulosolvens]KNY29007.1 hypothetical protein Bccel_4281 [Pseudobacteroides cellulosolvens ATCC 35603 = DSM 2933]
MTKEQFEREKNYRVSMSIAKAMLAKGIITMNDFKRINKILLTEYKPVIGGI